MLDTKDISIQVIRKRIKNLYLNVHPPDGLVKVSAPVKMDKDAIRLFVLSKLEWIKKQQKKIKDQKREIPKKFINGEYHYFEGNKYDLALFEVDKKPIVYLNGSTLEMHVRPQSDIQKKKSVLDSFYRKELKKKIFLIISKWENIIGVNVEQFGVKKMKTRWGTCNITKKRIWINLELAKPPSNYLEYIIIHEMVHLLERNHTLKFKSYMDSFSPNWRKLKEELDRFPI